MPGVRSAGADTGSIDRDVFHLPGVTGLDAPLPANQADEKAIHHNGFTALFRRFGLQSKRHQADDQGRGIAPSQR